MKVSAQNSDGSLELLFEVNDEAVEERQLAERREQERAFIIAESGLTEEQLDELGPTEYETILNLVSMGFYRALDKVGPEDRNVMVRLTDHSGKVKVHTKPEFKESPLRKAIRYRVCSVCSGLVVGMLAEWLAADVADRVCR